MHAGPLFGGWPFVGLEPRSYDLLMIDAPWLYNLYSSKGEAKSAQRQYRCLPLAEIKAFPIIDLAAENCLIWVWATNPMLVQAIECISAWGFKLKTAGSWNKVTKTGKQAFGTGYILRSSNEPFLIATRGKPKTTKSVRSSFDGVVRAHSQKPEEGFAVAERLMPRARRAEIFSRTDRPGWQSWGDQVGILNSDADVKKMMAQAKKEFGDNLLL